MKKALHYVLTNSWDLGIMAVTSEKGDHLYGRDCRWGNPTHRLKRDTIGPFGTQAHAERCRDGIADIRRQHERMALEHQEALGRIRQQKCRAIRTFIEREQEELRKRGLLPDQDELSSLSGTNAWHKKEF